MLIGECGIPFDLGSGGQKSFFFRSRQRKTAFETGDFKTATHALSRTLNALDHGMASYTIWCYQPDNTNEYGDGWNGEDLSLFSRDQIKPGEEDDLFAGGRALLAAIRPYPVRVAGEVLRFSFDLYRKDRRFDLVFRIDQDVQSKETIVFLPMYQYPHGVNVVVTKGTGKFNIDRNAQTLIFTHDDNDARRPPDERIIHLVVTKVSLEESRRPSLELPSVA